MKESIYPLTLFYDAGCEVCALEMDHLRERCRDGRLRFVDIAAPGFDPAPLHCDLAAMNAQIHGLRADGTMLRGLEVLRLAYAAAGIGWMLRPTAFAPLAPLFDAGYRLFARHRQPISRFAAGWIAALRECRARRSAARMQRCQAGDCDLRGRKT